MGRPEAAGAAYGKDNGTDGKVAKGSWEWAKETAGPTGDGAEDDVDGGVRPDTPAMELLRDELTLS